MKKGTKFFLGLALLLWCLLVLLDWGGRFVWFKWHRVLILQPSSGALVQKPRAPMKQRTDTIWGGNLSHLIGIPSVAHPFEEQRSSHVATIDEYGFYNEPPTTQKWYDIVVTGDSFMTTPDWIEDTFPSQLSRISGCSVYNYARKGVGPFIGPLSFFQDKRFQLRPPKILIYGAVEADISGPLYVGLIYQLEHSATAPTNTMLNTPRVHWEALTASRLKASLPNTSLLAQASRKSWTYLRYILFRSISTDVVVAERAAGEDPLLFYRYNLQSLHWTLEKRDLPRVMMTFRFLDRYCTERGIRLVVVLIPDKEQVYRERIPLPWRGADGVLPSSCLPTLEKELQAEGILTVNVLTALREQAVKGKRLYWQDDTHWNAEGIRIAAEEVWTAIRSSNETPCSMTRVDGQAPSAINDPRIAVLP